MVEAVAEVLGDEVGGGGGGEAVADAGEGGSGVLEGFKVTGVGHEGGLGGGVELAPGGGQGLAEFLQPVAGLGGDDEQLPCRSLEQGSEGFPHGADGLSGRCVGLVEQEDQLLLVCHASSDVPGAGEQGLLRLLEVEHGQHELGGGEFLVGPFDADTFDGVVALAQARRIDETEEHAVEVAGLFDGVARGACDVGNDGAVLAEQGIEEGAFSGVCASNNCHGNTVFNGVT